MGNILTAVMVIALITFGLAQLWAGYIGIEHHFGYGWAILAVIVALFRFPLPLTIGSFFGAMDVWGWHWVLALLFAAPGLAFMVPATIAFIFAGGKK